jgi:hypothetical protein
VGILLLFLEEKLKGKKQINILFLPAILRVFKDLCNFTTQIVVN